MSGGEVPQTAADGCMGTSGGVAPRMAGVGCMGAMPMARPLRSVAEDVGDAPGGEDDACGMAKPLKSSGTAALCGLAFVLLRAGSSVVPGGSAV